MRALVFGIVIGIALGCRRAPPPVAGAQGEDPLAALRLRPADPLRGRLSFKIASEPLGLKGSTGGALFVDRPGRLHFAVLGPFGGTLATMQTDGSGASIELTRQAQHFWADDVEATVRQWTGDELGLDDVVGLFLGQVPPPSSPRRLTAADDGAVRYVRSPGRRADRGGVEVTLAGAPLRPRTVRLVDADGVERLSLTYDGWEAYDAGVLPSAWTLEVPELELTLDVRFRSFESLDEAPDVFGTEAPEGFVSAPWSVLTRGIGAD